MDDLDELNYHILKNIIESEDMEIPSYRLYHQINIDGKFYRDLGKSINSYSPADAVDVIDTVRVIMEVVDGMVRDGILKSYLNPIEGHEGRRLYSVTFKALWMHHVLKPI